MILAIILLIIGLVILIIGANWLVEGGSAIAFRLGIKPLVIGLTIVAFGTSAPELIVNIFASLNGSTDLAIGNVIGSNIVNILLILGIASVIYPLKVHANTVWKEIPFTLLAAIVLAFMVNDTLIDHLPQSALTRTDGLILLGFMAIFMYYIAAITKNTTGVESDVKQRPWWLAGLMVVGGITGLVLGGKWIVDSAIVLATSWGASEALIGLTVVAVGTSLPELATSAVAAYKKSVDIAVGNIVGSNIFNIFFILGISSVISPLPFSLSMNTDIIVVLLATFLLFIAMFVDKLHTLQRWQGCVFIGIYIAYVSYIISRG